MSGDAPASRYGRALRAAWRLLRLRFPPAARERAFRRDHACRVTPQTRVSLITGAIAYAVLGLEDPWFFPDAYPAVWAIRLAAILVITIGFLLTFRPSWQRHSKGIIAAVGLLAGCGPLAMVALGSL